MMYRVVIIQVNRNIKIKVMEDLPMEEVNPIQLNAIEWVSSLMSIESCNSMKLRIQSWSRAKKLKWIYNENIKRVCSYSGLLMTNHYGNDK